jgi:hypothetical protein
MLIKTTIMTKKMNKKLNHKKISSKTEDTNKNSSAHSINEPNKNYPKDIQGLFEKLGIE